MGAYTTISIDKEQYSILIPLIRQGFIDDSGMKHRPNNRVATALVTQYNLGVRISDICALHLNDIIKDGNRYRLDIAEIKTCKTRTFTVADQIYTYLSDYCKSNGIEPHERIFPITERNVQKILKAAVEYLGLQDVSTHSFRKFAANELLEQSNNDFELVREFLNHSSIATTQRYVKRSDNRMESALAKHVNLI